MKNKNDDTKRMPTYREGVDYIPSSAYGQGFEGLDETKKITPQTPDAKPKSHVRKRKAPKKSHYAIFMVTTVFVGVVAAVFLFAMVFNELAIDGIGGGSGNGSGNGFGLDNDPYHESDPFYNYDSSTVDEMPIELADGNVSLLGAIQIINPASSRIDVYDVANSQTRSFFAESHSVLRDKFGNVMTFGQFSVGDVIEVVHPAESNIIELARLSAQVQTYRNIRDVLIDNITGQLLIGNRRFDFNNNTIVMHRGNIDSIASITQTDVLNVEVLRNYNFVTFIDIQQGSGTVIIPQNDTIAQATIEIAQETFISKNLDDDTEISLPEGEHRIVIRGANIEDFYYHATIGRGETVYIDFDGLELLAGALTVYVEDPLATLTINGEIQMANSPIILEYGTYTIAVTRDGFEPFEEELTINSPTHQLNVELEEIIITQNVMITTSPAGARVYVEGQYIGISPVSVELELRRYSLTLALEGFVGVSPDIWVTEERPVFSFMLTQEPVFVPEPAPFVLPTPVPFVPIDDPIESGYDDDDDGYYYFYD